MEVEENHQAELLELQVGDKFSQHLENIPRPVTVDKCPVSHRHVDSRVRDMWTATCLSQTCGQRSAVNVSADSTAAAEDCGGQASSCQSGNAADLRQSARLPAHNPAGAAGSTARCEFCPVGRLFLLLPLNCACVLLAAQLAGPDTQQPAGSSSAKQASQQLTDGLMNWKTNFFFPDVEKTK